MERKTKLAQIKHAECNETDTICAHNEDEEKIIEQRPDFVRWVSSWLICPDSLINS